MRGRASFGLLSKVLLGRIEHALPGAGRAINRVRVHAASEGREPHLASAPHLQRAPLRHVPA